MTNKELISKLKDNAELAMASYGYFHLVNKKLSKNDLKRLNKDSHIISLVDILDINYSDSKVVEIIQQPGQEAKEITIGTLKGDFAPHQAKHFFERYDLLIHQPNTESGFSASLFQNKESKEFSLAIRGTEMSSFKDLLGADFSLSLSSTPKAQYEDMILF